MDSKTLEQWNVKYGIQVLNGVNGIYVANEEEFGEFDRIPDEQVLHGHTHICGLIKMLELMKDPSVFEFRAYYKSLWLTDLNNVHNNLTEEDYLYLLRCGIYYNHIDDCFVLDADIVQQFILNVEYVF